VATGIPEQIAANEKSFTGKYLRPVLERKVKPQRKKVATG
jgi:excinuclease UvrABC ATPase subunit